MKTKRYCGVLSLVVLLIIVYASPALARQVRVAFRPAPRVASHQAAPAVVSPLRPLATIVAVANITPTVIATPTVTPPTSPPAYCDNIHAEYPAVVLVGDTYYAYYSGFTCSWNLFYATSKDGVNFDKQGQINIKGDDWAKQRAFPFVIYTAGVFKLWYGGGLPYQIGYAESSDGVNFTAQPQPGLAKGGKQDWDSGQVLRPSIVQVSGPSADELARFGLPATTPRLYLMYYNGFGNNQSAIGLAYSTDGKAWQRYAANPVLTSDSGIYTSFALRVAGTTYLYFHTADALYLATSVDGINFTAVSDAPVLSPQTVNGWDAGLVYGAFVLQREDGSYAMYYNGIPALEANYGMVGLATSDDLIRWTVQGNGPVLTVGNTPANFTATVNPDGSISVRWHNVVRDATRYELRYGFSSGVYTASLDVSAWQSYTFTPPYTGDIYLTIIATTAQQQGHPAAEQHVYIAPR